MTNILTLMISGFLGWLIYELRQMRKSVEVLNVQIAVVVKEVEFHESRITRLEGSL